MKINKGYKEDIESFLDYVEGKTTNPTGMALRVFKRYEKKLEDIETWPKIFGDLYGAIYICKLGEGYYTIDGVHDCFPKTHYKNIESLYKSHLKDIELTLRNVYEEFYKDGYDVFLYDYLDEGEELETEDKDKIISDFYNTAFKGGNPDNACIEAWNLYRKYSEKNLYDIEVWPEIFNQALGEELIRKEEDGYHIYQLGFWSKEDVGSYEEIYRDILGWEKETLDFKEVWNKFYKYYIGMEEALDKYGCREDS